MSIGRAYDRLSRELRRRVYLMIGRAVLTVVNDETSLQTVQVVGLADEVIDGAERFQMYGITSHPLEGADALVLSVGGMRQHPIVLVDDRRHRVRELDEGEVCLYTHRDDPDSDGYHRIVMNKNREIDIRCGRSRLVMTPTSISLAADRIDIN